MRTLSRNGLGVAGALLALAIGSLTAHSLPLYSDALWLDSETLAPHALTQQRAGQIDRLTDYINKTFRVSSDKSVAIVTEAVYHGDKHDLSPELILAIIAVESTFQEKAVSPVGALGLMQVLPKAHPKKVRAIGGKQALFDRKKNIATGVKILNEYLSRSQGNLKKALLRYNGSLANPNSRYADKVLNYYKKFRKVVGPQGLS